ncbi:hypothetical protein GCM10010988_41050 [Cnuibacter physcomitrellae]|uniref:hypothetical protein n=1 Tax=Cnuibacter physcomitrellae TaxID=1619308 RepID=UPI00166F3DCB|nr:hypothetical protein [Cnuibacter physcomitrellae]GGI42838.1 hypothetical protein GCM10010988_41050 [Cnuibacter physcomitrellae]
MTDTPPPSRDAVPDPATQPVDMVPSAPVVFGPHPATPPAPAGIEGWPAPNPGTRTIPATPAGTNHQRAAERPRRTGLITTAAVAGALLVGSVAGSGAWALWDGTHGAGSSVSGPATVTITNPQAVAAVSAVAAKASPSVVTIDVSSSNGSGTGSGVMELDPVSRTPELRR